MKSTVKRVEADELKTKLRNLSKENEAYVRLAKIPMSSRIGSISDEELQALLSTIYMDIRLTTMALHSYDLTYKGELVSVKI